MNTASSAVPLLDPASRPLSRDASRAAAVAKDASGFGRYAALGTRAAGLVYLCASVVDFATLWVLQRQPTIQWEMVAVNQTLDGLPRFYLALGFLFVSLHLSRSSSLFLYRLLAVGLLLLGLLGAGLAGLIGTTYLALIGNVPPEAVRIIQSSVLKAVALGGLYACVSIPLGILGLRRPRSA